MNHCDFYRSNTRDLASRELTSSQQQHACTSETVVWCIHKHSPCTEVFAKSVVGGGRGLLTCGGDFDKCTISLENFIDVVPD